MEPNRNIVGCSDSYQVRVREMPPCDFLDLAEAGTFDGKGVGEPTFFWEYPERDEAWFACGVSRSFVAAGDRRIETVRADVKRFLHQLRVVGDARARPRAIGGFAFASKLDGGSTWREFPAAWFFVPRLLWLRRRGRCVLIEVEGGGGMPRSFAAVLRPSVAQPAERPHEWLDRVRDSLARIHRGDLEKIVLSRQWRLRGVRPALVDVLRSLRDTRPGCVTFAFKPETTVLFGSTPELIVRCRGSRFLAPALAGTVRRGGNAAEDEQLARALLFCPKNRREHEAVVAGIRRALAPLDVELGAREMPHVIALPEALHLQTPISGRAGPDCDALALAAALHPTPAVCGTPRSTAARLLDESEAHRGWYTGAIGWMDAAGDGDLAAVLRSALADGGNLTLFAGAGIVRGSEPEAEFEETELKMLAMLSPIRDASRRTEGAGELVQGAVPA
jgi:isochorismate synthase